MNKLGRKQLPAGLTPDDFTYKGRPAADQDDFGSDVGIADCACVNQFGEANNNKFYHGGVVQSSDGRWWCYFEWGRCKAGPSWSGSAWTKNAQDFQFYECSDEADARAAFAKQMKAKNVKRLLQRDIGGSRIWTAKNGKDGYLVQDLATREKGLPDARSIKSEAGLDKPKAAAPAKKKARKAAPTRTFQSQVVALAQALVGGVQTYTRSLAQASGITPTMATIERVRTDIIPAAMQRIKVVGNKVERQVVDPDLIDLSKLVAALVPRPIPRTGVDAAQAILSADNILVLQQDLDAFEAALRNEDFTPTTHAPSVNPDTLLNAKLTWLDPRSAEGKWVRDTFLGMDPGRHANVRHLRVRHIFAVERPDRDKLFVDATKRLARRRKGQPHGHVGASYQPRRRSDLADVSDCARDANVFIGIHGTRAVNVAPILQSNLRLPKSLAGVHITGAAFGHGLYFATQVGKSAQYVGSGSSVYGSGGGVRGRGYFMFLCDVAGGKFYYPTSAWTLSDRVPGDGDSVFAHPSRIRTLQNDEHVVFDPAQQRIRYVVEMDL